MARSSRRSQLALVFALVALGSCLQQNGAQALKLPSFLSWIQPQPQPQQQSQLQQPQSQKLAGAASSQAAGQLRLQSLQRPSDDPMSTSASNFDASRAQQQAHVSPLRKPFQSMLMLPAKSHQMQLFSALPKSLFGRLLSAGSQGSTTAASAATTAASSAGPPLSWSAHDYPALVAAMHQQQAQLVRGQRQHQAELQQPHQHHQLQQQQQQQQFRKTQGQFNGFQLQQVQPQFQQQQQARHLEQAKKHALGFGESDDFLVVEMPNVGEQNEHPYEQQQEPQTAASLHQGMDSAARMQQKQVEEYREVPTIVVADEEPLAQRPLNSSAELDASRNESSAATQIALNGGKLTDSSRFDANETSSNESAARKPEPAIPTRGREQKALEADMAHGEEAGSQQHQPTGSNLTTSDQDQWHESNSSSQTLASMINDELMKLRPDSLNKSSDSPVGQSPGVSALGSQQQQQADGASATGKAPQSDGQVMLAAGRPLSTSAQLESSESGRLESSAAAFIVAPNEAASQAAFGGQLEPSSDEQIESFIIGPYKGLTSDNLAQLAESDQFQLQRQQQAGRFQVAVNMELPRQSQQQQQQQQHQTHGLGMSSVASNLFQQAKSLIQLPFVHMASSGPREQKSVAARPREPLAELSSAVAPFALAGHPGGSGAAAAASSAVNNLQQEQVAKTNYRLRQQTLFATQQQQQQSVWPPATLDERLPSKGATAAGGAVRALAGQQASLLRNSDRYFLRPTPQSGQAQQSGKQQQPIGANNNFNFEGQTRQLDLRQPQLKSNVPYFADASQQRPPMSRESQLAAGAYQPAAAQRPQAELPARDNGLRADQLQPIGSAAELSARQGHPLNNLPIHQRQREQAAVQPAVQQTGFQLVVNHGDSSRAAHSEQQRNGETRAAAVHLQQQQQQQQQHNRPELSRQRRKFKSGLYQIEPPKLATDSNPSEQQQQQLVEVQESEAEEEQQMLKQEPESDDDDEVEQQATESPEANEAAKDLVRQVGSSIEVSGNKTLRGRVFNEPISSAGSVGARTSASSPDAGLDSSQVKSLKLSQDITLYDLEVPHREQQFADAQRLAEQSASANQQPISYLDTQVYTLPYTISMQPDGRAQLSPQQMPVTNYMFQSYQQHQQPLASALQHQQNHARFAQHYAAPSGVQPGGASSFRAAQDGGLVGSQADKSGLPRDHRAQHSFLRTIFHELIPTAGPRTRPRLVQPAKVPLSVVQTIGEQTPEPPVAQINLDDVTFADTPSALGQPDRQHYFHYQPVATVAQAQRSQLNLRDQRPAAGELMRQRPIPTEQSAYELATRAPVSSQQQYMLAVQHGGHPATPNGAALFSSSASIGGSQLPVLQTQQLQRPGASGQSSWPGHATKPATPSLDITMPLKAVTSDVPSAASPLEGFQQKAFRTSTAGSVGSESNTAADGTNQEEEEEDYNENNQLQAAERRPANKGPFERARLQQSPFDQAQPASKPQQSSPVSNSQVPSSPSAFCADRAPGLYADETQRCKAYYQCAPTGHQMFRCNNQTQFNQKTQNCDWWYNVNCGGRLGSPSDFEQAILTSILAESAGQSEQPQQDHGQIPVTQEPGFGQQAEENQTMPQQQQPQQQQEMQPAQTQPTRETEEQPSGGAGGVELPQVARQQANRRPEGEEMPDLFHHSESRANSTVAPDSSQQQQDQQMAPTSSTPALSQQAERVSMAPNLRLLDLAERSSTTQDSILLDTSPSSGSANITEPPSGETPSSASQASEPADTRPQVGANLSGEGDQTSSSSATSASSSSSSSSASASPAFSDGATTTSSTISDSSDTQTASPSGLAATTTTASNLEQVEGGGASVRQSGDQELADAEASKTRRLVQSEFGLGVQQQQQQQQARQREGAKSARSAGRFEFTRSPAGRQAEQSLSNGSMNEQTGAADEQAQHANHNYSAGEQAEPQIYSTSANQGSVSYIPVDTVQFLTSRGLQLTSGGSERQGGQSEQAGRKVERRFGARLAGPGRSWPRSAGQGTSTTPAASGTRPARFIAELTTSEQVAEQSGRR